MNDAAVVKARRKLEKLYWAIDKMRCAERPEEVESAWEEFVLGSGSIYSVLEQGAKTTGKSQGWFGLKKRDRKKDQLLRYLHFARNCEEHGLEKITGTGSSSITLSPGSSVQFMSDGTNWRIIESNGTITPKNDIVYLVRVTDKRFGDFADVPQKHFGTEIGSNRPLAVAEAAIKYFGLMLKEAEALAQTASR